jgi:hypothetical protein
LPSSSHYDSKEPTPSLRSGIARHLAAAAAATATAQPRQPTEAKAKLEVQTGYACFPCPDEVSIYQF